MKGFQKLTPVDDTLRKFLGALQIGRPRATLVLLDQTRNRVLARNVIAEEDLPRFDRSAVDGYAVEAEDTAETSQFKPRTMTIIDTDEVAEGTAKQIWTGNSVPEGADAVVMLENTKRTDDKIEVSMPLAPGENISKKGEDVKKGEVALAAGTRLRPQHLGLLAALGMAHVDVFEVPKIAILATGNELVDLGNRRQNDQVFDVNRHVISALCQELGAEPLDLGIAEDDIEEIIERLRAGLAADAVITTGGTSVGASDFVPDAVNRLGKPGVVVHGVAMRPAMPTALAIVNGKPILIFSGNPVAAMIGFEVFARPLICRMLGLEHEESRPTVEVKIARKVATALGRRTFVRVQVIRKGKQFYAEPISTRGSGIISTMTRANGYVVVPENREGLGEGELVVAHLFDDVEVARNV